MTRRTAGGGTVEPLPSGKWSARITLATGKRERLPGTFTTKDEALSVLDAALRKLASAELAPVGGITVAQWGQKFIDRREIRREVSDVENDRSLWKTHVASHPIASLPVAATTRRDWRDWLEHVRSKGRARQTVQNALNLVRTCLRAAVDDEVIRVNPVVDLRVPRERRTKDPWTYLQPAEQRTLMASVVGPERCIVAFAMGTGLRAGELVALRLEDIHDDGAEPFITVRYGGAPDKPTKTGKIRQVPLFGLALVAWRVWKENLSRYLAGRRNRKGIAFPGRGAGFRSEEHVLRWDEWKHALDKAKLGRRFRWHDLRHTCASSLLSGWWGRKWSMDEVRGMLGHGSRTTTERYAHLADSALRSAARETTESTRGPQLPEHVDSIDQANDFLNRWSDVRFVSGAQAVKHSAPEKMIHATRGLRVGFPLRAATAALTELALRAGVTVTP